MDLNKMARGLTNEKFRSFGRDIFAALDYIDGHG